MPGPLAKPKEGTLRNDPRYTPHTGRRTVSPAMRYAVDAVSVLARIRGRLESTGAVVELDQFAQLSVDELDLLVLRELGA